MQVRIKKVRDTVTPQLRNIISALGVQKRREVLLLAGKEFINETMTNFGGNSGFYKDGVWPNLSKNYSKRIGSSKPTLDRSGKLKNSITLSSPFLNYIVISTKNPYAAAHMLGSTKRNIPKRNFFPVQFQAGNPRSSKLVWNSHLRITFEIGRRFHQLSNGALPMPSYFTNRWDYQEGNPFAPPQNPQAGSARST